MTDLSHRIDAVVIRLDSRLPPWQRRLLRLYKRFLEFFIPAQ